MAAVVEPDPAAIRRAARLLRDDRLVAFPTETVYGLGGWPRVRSPLPQSTLPSGDRLDTLIVHLADLQAAASSVSSTIGSAPGLSSGPEPPTIVVPLPRNSGVTQAATAELDSIALRVPIHPVAQALLREVAAPVAAPSANPSGRISPTQAAHVAADLGQSVALVLNGGPCQIGVESTVVELLGVRPRLLRPGGLDRAALERVLVPSTPQQPARPHVRQANSAVITLPVCRFAWTHRTWRLTRHCSRSEPSCRRVRS